MLLSNYYRLFYPMKIINFSIIAHIDHGKSTLASKFISLSKKEDRNTSNSFMDSMELEQERGITIKSKAVRFFYNYKSEPIQFNMIDTPGHVDFSYEVSKALYACNYAFLLVDATKGVQAQTISNAYKALNQNVEIVPVINKVDMVNAEVDRVVEEVKSNFGFAESDIFRISAKTGEGVNELLEHLIEKSTGFKQSNKVIQLEYPRALIFDSFYDEYVGVVILCLVQGGDLKKGYKVYLNSNKVNFEIQDTGYFNPQKVISESLKQNEVGFIVTGLKDLSQVNVGDTVLLQGHATEVFPNFEIVKPIVFLGVFPKSSEDIQNLRKALDVLHLNDSSFTYKPESAGTLGYGFNCGFLGILHADILLERVKREFDIDIIVTNPSVSYVIKEKNKKTYKISSAREFPDPTKIDYIKEPFVMVTVVTPEEYLGKTMQLATSSRGEFVDTQYISISNRTTVKLIFKAPLSEIIVNFNDNLKSLTAGFASFDYEFIGYKKADIVKLDIYIHNEIFPPLSTLVHQERSESRGREIVTSLKEELNREQFSIPLQAAIGGKIIARETIRPYRKDVTAKLYGGDQTRKTKLLDKQKKGKKRMKVMGRVDVDKDTFLKVIRKN